MNNMFLYTILVIIHKHTQGEEEIPRGGRVCFQKGSSVQKSICVAQWKSQMPSQAHVGQDHLTLREIKTAY